MTTSIAADGFRMVGSLSEISAADRALLVDRRTSDDAGVRQTALGIIDHVRREGDRALFALAEELDGVTLASLEVPRAEMRSALAALPAEVRRAMERAAVNIEATHRALLPGQVTVSPEPGIRIVRRPDPLRRVGVYAPGGRAAYPSSVLMGAIPARVAGVEEVVLCSPPDATGLPALTVLAAAEMARVNRVFAVGGAGAIAALAYGTATIPRVDRIVGPGNAYVAEAKLLVSGVTGIDSPAGPSEMLVIADGTASPSIVAQEVLAQAEHDPAAIVIVVAVGDTVASTVCAEIVGRIELQRRGAIIASALRDHGAVLSADSLDDAIRFANEFAPEHLLLACAGAEQLAARARNAGTIFVGETSSVTYGDYMTGANHVLPTGGLARCYSGLSVLDFIRWTTVQSVDRAAAGSLAEDVGIFADAEGLPAHAAAAREWGRR